MSSAVRSRTLPYAGLTLLTALALAACGGGSSTTSGGAPAAGSTPAPTTTAGGQSGGQSGQGQRSPGVSGLIAAVSGSTMQVQTRTDQTAVTWTDATTFSKQATASLADVTTGSCVTVLEPASASTATATPGAGPTQVTAGTVQVRPATNGQCAGGFGGFASPGGGPSGAVGPGAAGGGSATAAPTRTGGNGARGGFGRGVNGVVMAVTGDTVTVQEMVRGASSTTASDGAAPGTTRNVTVMVTGSTTYFAEKAAAAADVAVGECATAMGKADDTGTVAATAISLRPATNGSCTGNGGAGRPTGTTTTGSANG